jgi:hypothetical protein
MRFFAKMVLPAPTNVILGLRDMMSSIASVGPKPHRGSVDLANHRIDALIDLIHVGLEVAHIS